MNKNEKACSVLVRTVDDQARAGEDYEELVEIVHFKNGEAFHIVEVKINDYENWEPDEDFWVQLYETNGNQVVGDEKELRG